VTVARLLSLLFLASSGFASGGGSSGAEFLRVAQGARPAALGENFTGLADDVTAVAWNPAGLARLKGVELSAMHLNYLGDASHEFLAAGMPAGGWGAFALSGTYVSMKPFDYTQPGSGLPAGSASDLLAALSWGASAGPLVPEEPWYRDLYVGATAKFIRRSLGGYTDAAGNPKTYAATAGALDLGALYQWRRDLTAGLAVQNLGTGISFLGDEKDPLPLAARLGVAWTVAEGPWLNAVALADAVMPSSGGGTLDQGVWGGAGLELRIADVLSLRAGARQGADGFRAVGGAGVSFAGVSLDLAYIPLGELGTGGTQGIRMGLTAKLGGGAPRLGAVRNLTAAAAPQQGAHLRWDAQAAAEGYHVEARRPGDAAFVRLTKRPLAASELTLKGLKPSADYAFRVIPLDARGHEGPSGTPVSLRTAAPPAVAAPAKIKAFPARGKVTITWSAVPGATGYYVYVRGKDRKWAALTKTPLTATRLTLKGKASVREYAVGAYGEGGTKGKAKVVKAAILR